MSRIYYTYNEMTKKFSVNYVYNPTNFNVSDLPNECETSLTFWLGRDAIEAQEKADEIKRLKDIEDRYIISETNRQYDKYWNRGEMGG